jgi:hypothetical protein
LVGKNWPNGEPSAVRHCPARVTPNRTSVETEPMDGKDAMVRKMFPARFSQAPIRHYESKEKKKLRKKSKNFFFIFN